jgi:hypothetical protein
VIPDARLAFLGFVLAQEGKPYIWGAKGPDAFDCSGLVTAGLVHVGYADLRQTHNAHGLFRRFPTTLSPKPGDLAFYGRQSAAGIVEHISHVVVVTGSGDEIIGANGGNKYTTSAEIAARSGARVKRKPTYLYRPDFIAFGVSPLDAA